jgi:hypothetical protein
MPVLRRGSRPQGTVIAPEDVLWGVPLREGHSDTDDPIPHAKLVQHAFLLGVDERAVCGFKPPRRTSLADASPRPRLALSGTDNPRCPRCAALVGSGYGRRADGSSAAQSKSGGPGSEIADTDEATDSALDDADSFTDVEDLVVDVSTDDVGSSQSEPEVGGAKQRSSVRRGGRITVPPGRRSVIALLPERARGLAVAAEIDGPQRDLRVQSVTVLDDGTARITLNRRSETSVDVYWFVVSSHRRPI